MIIILCFHINYTSTPSLIKISPTFSKRSNSTAFTPVLSRPRFSSSLRRSTTLKSINLSLDISPLALAMILIYSSECRDLLIHWFHVEAKNCDGRNPASIVFSTTVNSLCSVVTLSDVFHCRHQMAQPWSPISVIFITHPSPPSSFYSSPGFVLFHNGEIASWWFVIAGHFKIKWRVIFNIKYFAVICQIEFEFIRLL